MDCLGCLPGFRGWGRIHETRRPLEETPEPELMECSTCRLFQPAENFSKARADSYRRHNGKGNDHKTEWDCRSCVKRKVAALEASMPTKVCASCGVELNKDNSSRSQRQRTVATRMCKVCLDDPAIRFLEAPPEDRAKCQCRCGCRGKPAKKGQRVCPVCGLMVGIGCHIAGGPCWVEAAGRCHMCHRPPEPDPEPVRRPMKDLPCYDEMEQQFERLLPRRKFLVLEGPWRAGTRESLEAYARSIATDDEVLQIDCIAGGPYTADLGQVLRPFHLCVLLHNLSVEAALNMKDVLPGRLEACVPRGLTPKSTPHPNAIWTHGLRLCISSTTWTEELGDVSPEEEAWVVANSIHYKLQPGETLYASTPQNPRDEDTL